LDDLLSSVYALQSESEDNKSLSKVFNFTKSDSTPFLQSLNAINGSLFKSLLNQLKPILKSMSTSEKINEIIFKLLTLISINGNEYSAVSIMSELIKISFNFETNGNETDSMPIISNNKQQSESILIKLRIEITPFHPDCLRKTIISLIHTISEDDIGNDEDKNDKHYQLLTFIKNLILIYQWDLQNQYFMRFFILFKFILYLYNSFLYLFLF
jgi:hypothetical protein